MSDRNGDVDAGGDECDADVDAEGFDAEADECDADVDAEGFDAEADERTSCLQIIPCFSHLRRISSN